MLPNTENGRWTYKRKTELVLSLIKKEISLVDVCRQYDLKQSEVEAWITIFMESGSQGLRQSGKEEKEAREQEITRLRAKVGELVLELEARKKLQALIESSENSSY